MDRYFKLLKREGADSPVQPCRHASEVIGDIVYLRNVNGLLAERIPAGTIYLSPGKSGLHFLPENRSGVCFFHPGGAFVLIRCRESKNVFSTKQKPMPCGLS